MTDLCLNNNHAMKFPAYVANFPAAASKLPAMADLTCLQLNPLQKEAVGCMLDAIMHPPQTETGGSTASDSISIPEQALGPSCNIAVIIHTCFDF